jgi:hypothetical protein
MTKKLVDLAVVDVEKRRVPSKYYVGFYTLIESHAARPMLSRSPGLRVLCSLSFDGIPLSLTSTSVTTPFLRLTA